MENKYLSFVIVKCLCLAMKLNTERGGLEDEVWLSLLSPKTFLLI